MSYHSVVFLKTEMQKAQDEYNKAKVEIKLGKISESEFEKCEEAFFKSIYRYFDYQELMV